MKLNNLDDLNAKGLYIIDDDAPIVINHIQKIIQEKNLMSADLSRISGVSRQTINAVIRNQRSPGIDFALKMAYVLNKPITEIFELTQNSWMRPYTSKNGEYNWYVDVFNMEIIDSFTKKDRISNTGFEYYIEETGKEFSKKDKEALFKKYYAENYEAKLQDIKDKDINKEMTLNQIISMAAEDVKLEFNNIYKKIYKKLGQKVEPYQLP